MSQPTKKQSKEFYEYECGNGPRPPVPGEESQVSKMTTEGACGGTSNTNRSPESEASLSRRISRWQENFSYLFGDDEGVQLLLKFVKEEAGEDSDHSKRLNFYFACEGLKRMDEDLKRKPDEKNPEKNRERVLRKVIRLLSEEYLHDNVIEVPAALRNTISQIIAKKIPPNPYLFDELQRKVVDDIAEKLYPTFLQSDVFIQFNNEQNRRDVTNNTTDQASAGSSSDAATSNTDGAASYSGMAVDLTPLISTSNLQTLHEDTELTISTEPIATKTTTDRPMPKLTKDLLLATQKGRLEVRPQGAHGYTYKVPFNSSYNPVSRQDSERQSCSSASLTDSEVNSKDGKPFIHRRLTPAEDYRTAHVNPPVLGQRVPLKPLAQGPLREVVDPIPKSRLAISAQSLNAALLCEKLNALKHEQDKSEKLEKPEKFNRCLNEKLITVRETRVFNTVDDDDQSILDQHVSRVFSPQFSPGTISPKHLHRYQQRYNEMSTSMPNFVAQPMRHSRSIPEHASTTLFSTTTKKLFHKSNSGTIDSGISLYSGITPYKTKDMKSIEQLSEETMRKSKDDTRRIRKQMPLMPQTSSQQLNLMPTSSSHHTNSLPRVRSDAATNSMSASANEEYTFAVYTFGDEKIPYRTKIPGKRLTLKHFKEYLPKKGNFRFFFTTVCDDPDNPVIQEEVINDMDTLPLYEGKIMGTLKSE